jgi:hypothetical protein
LPAEASAKAGPAGIWSKLQTAERKLRRFYLDRRRPTAPLFTPPSLRQVMSMQWITKPVGWLVSALAFALGVYGLMIIVFTSLPPGLFWVKLTLLFAGWFPVILVHELGHAIAAWLVGWRVWIFHVAPFAIYTRPLSWRFTGDLSGPDIAGFVLALPRDAKTDTWRRSAWVSLGGPIASWLQAALCLSVLWWSPLILGGYDDSSWSVEDPAWMSALILALGCYALAAALLSSWPRKTQRDNDGQHILEIVAAKKTLGVPQSGGGLASLLSKHGIRVSAMEPWMIEGLARSGGLPDAVASEKLTRILEALLRNDMAAAQSLCEQLARDHPLSIEARAARAFSAVWFDADIAAADAILAKLHVPVRDDCFRLRQLTLAAIHKLENEVEAAEHVLDELMSSTGGAYRFSSSAWETLCRHVMQRAPLARPA